ncbi:YqjD family protein [Klebsiella oxytoca]|uniref:DUF883 family protein n=1 Tax=Klebsiella oxytoca TaxID=571 RepID=UPI001158F07C|nr:DUF883 family protein [Klebsiella oxytoca]EJA2381965.1 DUF883 family protein [Klebsiella oxytoca]EJZ8299176.1 DUF883 family protein [Klebsiella oxytoca]EKM0801267.1 DUF883 family protein [Klebsiella oxytoca]ELI3677334.1 DUF883 family protein [Klebsiella oxytoca]ELI3682492.1 DUF883 family protein [Klebsiella oxytoca]
MSSQEYENDAQNLADKVGNKVNEFAGEAQQQFGDAVDLPKHQLKGAARKYAAQASDAVSEVSERVRENPLTGLLAAGAIGLVIGLLAGRK